MSRARLARLLLALAGCGDLTEVVVRVSASGVAIPTELDSLRITVTDPSGSGADAAAGPTAYASPTVTLCAPGATSASCDTLPVTLTLVPGPHDPTAPVRVEVDGFAPGGGSPSTDDAAVFSFVRGVRQELDFDLSSTCLGVHCAGSDAACDESGTCAAVAPVGPEMPDLAMPSITQTAAAGGTAFGKADGTTPTTVELPPVAPGDLLVAVAFAIDSGASQLLPSPWIPLADVASDGVFVVAYRRADGSPADRTLSIGVISTGATDAEIDWLFYGFRGAGVPSLREAIEDTVLPPTLPALSLPGGDVYLGFIDNPGTGTCTITPAGTVDQLLGTWFVFETLPSSLPAMEPAHSVSCAKGVTPATHDGELLIPPL